MAGGPSSTRSVGLCAGEVIIVLSESSEKGSKSRQQR